MNCFKMLLMLIPVLLIRCSAPEDQPAPEPPAASEAVQKKEEMKPDVRNVRWGMTPEEIRANEKLPLEQIDSEKNPDSFVLQTERMTLLGHHDTVLMYRMRRIEDEFHRLREVWYGFIVPSEGNALYVMSALREKYGRPTIDEAKDLLIWKTDDGRTTIELGNEPDVKLMVLKYRDQKMYQRHSKRDMDDL